MREDWKGKDCRSMLLFSGQKVPAVYIESDGLQTLSESIAPPTVTNYAEFVEAVRRSGVVGLGGAGFPTAMAISALRKVIPDNVRIPCYIVLIAGFVTVVQMLIKAYAPAIDEQLGIYLPLIVVNCIILGRAEMFANKNTVLDSALDGIGMFLLGVDQFIYYLPVILVSGTIAGVLIGAMADILLKRLGTR